MQGERRNIDLILLRTELNFVPTTKYNIKSLGIQISYIILGQFLFNTHLLYLFIF